MKTRLPVLLVFSLVSVVFAQTGARYLIIANDNFYNAVQPLAEWKTKKGMLCVVKRTSEIGTSNAQIRNFILNAYNTWNPRPEFVLLVGGPSYIPAFSKGMGQTRIDTDNPYGDMSGDYRAEIPCGRLPCKTLRQCSVMVSKVLTYERYPSIAETLWYRRATMIVNDSADDDAATYWNDVRFAAGLCAQNGYSAVDTLSSLRHHNAAHVAQSVNSGTSLVLYRGTGVDYWRAPFDMRPYLGGLTNYKQLPIVCSFTCQTISLSSYNDSMTGNTWMKVGTTLNPTGAAAVIGNTHSATNVAGRRSAMTRGFFTGLLVESLLTVGQATLRGKLQIYNEYRDSMDYMGFNLLGDPEMNVWTAPPHTCSPTYPEALPIGIHDFEVRLTGLGGLPVRNALVCIRTGDGVYRYGYTNAGGTILFSGVSFTSPGVMEVTITARNYLPHEGTVEIYDPSAVSEQPVFRTGQQTPVLRLIPSPSQGSVVISSTTEASVQVFSAAGRLVAQLHPSVQGCELKLEPGLYVVRAVDPSGIMTSTVLPVLK